LKDSTDTKLTFRALNILHASTEFGATKKQECPNTRYLCETAKLHICLSRG
jgi:hypothetical protein